MFFFHKCFGKIIKTLLYIHNWFFFTAAIANVTACIIATFQMNLLMGKSPSYKTWLTASSFVPAVSSSYYLSGLASILLFACSSISISFSGEMKITKPKTTKTIKQVIVLNTCEQHFSWSKFHCSFVISIGLITLWIEYFSIFINNTK